MAESGNKNAVGFPPPLLGRKPLRLPILAETNEWIAVDKPVGIGTRAHPWDREPNLDTAFNVQLKAGKPELIRGNATLFGSMFYLDPGISGVAIFAKNHHALDNLRNSFGSEVCFFRFRFIAPSQSISEKEYLECAAPLLPHKVKPKMIPSSAKGKKTFTRFERISESSKGWALWEARATFFRVQQVRAHAALLGIPVMGDTLYGGTLPRVHPEPQGKKDISYLKFPVYEGPVLHLEEVKLNTNQTFSVKSELPKHLKLLLRRMGIVV